MPNSSKSSPCVESDTTDIRRIKLPCFDMVVEIVNDDSASVKSSLCPQYGVAGAMIERLVLEHALSGVDIAARAYVSGIQCAVAAVRMGAI